MEEGVALRPQADEIIAGWWRYLPLVAVAFGLGGLLAFALLLPDLDGLVFGYVVMYIAGFVMLAILTYKQTRRLTAHMSREESIRQGMLEGIRARIEAGEGAKADQELTAMELVQKEASQQERLPNQAYAAMSVLPLVGLVVGYYYLYHLNRVTFPHDARWLRYLQEYSSAGSKVGVIAPLVPSPTVAKRSFALYALISLAFFPFLAYWYHVMIGEVNRHFQGQWKAEDELLSSAD
ncbi:MAG: hypothetical protein LUQ39_04215 [Methanomassiliicoccales archaeon]|nr:hypothetical protein [Methanomassiliicoccales archaeon]